MGDLFGEIKEPVLEIKKKKPYLFKRLLHIK